MNDLTGTPSGGPDGGPGGSVEKPINLVERVKELLLQPSQTWEKIALEAASVKSLYTGYVMILAAIPAVCTLIGTSLIGMAGPFLSFKMPLLWAVPIAVVQYLISLVMVYIFALVIDGLAVNFGAEKNKPQAFKVAAYSGTAAWLAGIFALIPLLGVLGLLGLYSIYLLYLGLKKLMKAPDDKAASYTAVVVIVMIVAGFVLNLLVVPLTTLGSLGAAGAGGGLFGAMNKPQGEVAVPGVGSVDLGKLEAASKQMESAASAMSTGEGVKVADGASLQALLPMTFEGAPQLNVESGSGGAGGMNASSAKAVYSSGEGSITLTVADMGTAGALAAMGAALNVNQSKQTATGYEKITSKDGVMTTEEYDNTTKTGKYAVITNTRLMVEADGEKVSMDKLKSAVASVDKAKAIALMQ